MAAKVCKSCINVAFADLHRALTLLSGMLPGRTISGEAGKLMLLRKAQQQAKTLELSFYPRLKIKV